MSVKLFNATAHQMAKALKKQARKSPEMLKELIDAGATKANGNLSTKKLKVGLIEEFGADCFTKSGKFSDKGRAILQEEGFTKKTTLKDFKKMLQNKALEYAKGKPIEISDVPTKASSAAEFMTKAGDVFSKSNLKQASTKNPDAFEGLIK